MIEKIIEWDTRLFLYLNSLHTTWLDVPMYWITDRFFWIPLYLGIMLLAYKWYGLRGFWLIAAAGLSVALADQFTTSFMKPYFARPRPCYDPVIGKSVFVLRGCGGQFGFASSHASTTFALATSLWLYGRKAFRYVWLMFLWAALVSYSRIYVGVHYPVDILVGAAAGATISLLVYLIYRIILRRLNFRIDPIPHSGNDGILNQQTQQ
jgi:undecaprenyl-diphosphatase